ncbi:MAG: DUF2062 domain-containing protein [Burkholderiales bacterium]|nr:DUF2062 domain-containing protein [Burkholderiales bacterium]
MSWPERLRSLIPSREALLTSRWLRWLSVWMEHPKLWRWSRRGVALGVAIGVFFGLLIPLAQIPLTAAAAIVLRANLPAAAASTLISNPVTFGPLYYAAFQLGSWITGETSLPSDDPATSASAVSEKTIVQRIAALGKPLLVGLFVMACFAGFLTYLLIDLIWRWHTWRRWRTRRDTGQGSNSS